jgi:hypothetical protein
VRLVALSRLELNGRTADVVSFVESSGRYGVDVDGTLMAIKPVNMEILPLSTPSLQPPVLRLRVKRLPLGIDCGEVRCRSTSTIADVKHLMKLDRFFVPFGNKVSEGPCTP